MKLNLFSKILFFALLAFTVNSFVYFSFGNIYSSKILNYENFQNQFHSGIYQYRVLSGYFLIWIYDFLSGLNIDYQIFKLKFFDSDSEPKMFLAFFILNTFFLVLTSMVMVLITETKNFIATETEKILIISTSIFAIALTQFVVVPYDISSYFLLLLFFYFLINYLKNNNLTNLIVLMIVLAVSTFNRESSALSIALAATVLLEKYKLKKESILPTAILGVTFVAVYLGMRCLSESFTTNDGNLFLQNFSQPKNWLGILFWLVFFCITIFISKDKTAVKNILIFHLFALPYIFMCIYTGILYEVRLYIPLFLASIFMSKLEVRNLPQPSMKTTQ